LVKTEGKEEGFYEHCLGTRRYWGARANDYLLCRLGGYEFARSEQCHEHTGGEEYFATPEEVTAFSAIFLPRGVVRKNGPPLLLSEVSETKMIFFERRKGLVFYYATS
jgi:hypothetical protein